MSETLFPATWRITTIGEVSQVNPPGSTLEARDNELVSFLPMAAVEELTGRIDTSQHRTFGSLKKGYTRFLEGDILFAKITPSMENGKIAIARGLKGGKGCGTTEFHVIRPNPGINADYLRYFVLRDAYRDDAKRHMSGAVGQQRVPADFLKQTELPVAPPQEQLRIVSKIDELFSRMEAGEAALRRAQSLVDCYRKSVLKAAVTGELTRDWREKHRDKIEPADKLLERILTARRKAWEVAELAKMKAKSKPPKDDSWKKRYTEPGPPNVSDLPELPDGWAWASIDQLSIHITSGSRDWKQFYGRGTGVFIMAQNVRPFRLDLTERQLVNPPKGDRDAIRSAVQKDDILLTIVGANTGDVCRVDRILDRHFVCQSVALIRPSLPELSPFLELYLGGAGPGKAQLEKHIYGAGRPHLGFEELKAVAVPVMPPDEQEALLKEASVHISRINRIAEHISLEAPRSRLLRQSILKSAFDGKLVAQTQKREAATALPERTRKAEQLPPSRRARRSR